jgi:hypothetical protein
MNNLPARRSTGAPRERSSHVTVRVTHTLRVDRDAYLAAFGMDGNAEIQRDVRMTVLDRLATAPEAMQGLWTVTS